MFLFVGLGNPTDRYKNTRHNIGFMVIDQLVGNLKTSSVSKPQFFGELYKDAAILLLKPLTYMNESGKSVRAVADFYKPDEIIVIHDDIAIPFGSVRIKKGGSSGGHNGLKSIDAHIGDDYIRVRLGVGMPKNGRDTAIFVLSDFAMSELACLDKLIERGALIANDLKRMDLDLAITLHTSKKGICAQND
jgi:PTH1 family peptidyl-tRNA hydrolase